MRSILAVVFTCVVFLSTAQIVSISPPDATGEDKIVVTFDASAGNGELAGATKVYMHSGVITDAPDGMDWQHVVGNWGQDDGVGEMTQVTGEANKWQITLEPTARQYYSVPSSETIFRLSMVFRNADGSKKGTDAPGEYDWGTIASNQDIFVNLAVGHYLTIKNPTQSDVYVEQGKSLNIEAEASSEVTAMTISLDEGNGYNQVASVSSGTSISYAYTPTASTSLSIKIDATIQEESLSISEDVNVLLRGATPQVDLPAGVKKGINYDPNNTGSVTLVLQAPGKQFAYVVGDFNDWTPSDNYLMNQTTDREYFWYQLDGLTEGKEYVFQYWVDGSIRIGDPYADKVADPWNDQYIPKDVYPNPVPYDKTDYQMATILQTGQQQYQWADTEASWSRPDKHDLVVYELLVRDFLGTHSYKDLTDTLSYLKRLGINAIELMPIMEFEGNESWGYNPVYYFAPDKYYGTKDDLKHFIETAHAQGFAVILDMVLNHAFGQCPLVKLYWDATANEPAANSPWFNQQAPHPYSVGYDFNHDSKYTRAFVDTVNQYWVNEYHFDGYRFDLSKGFTQTYSGDDVGKWGQYDPDRISNLSRMNKVIENNNPETYVILEHFAVKEEEDVLGNLGMLMWRNSHGDFEGALKGNKSDISSASSITHVAYMESHDEERQMYAMLNSGNSGEGYDVRNLQAALERAKMGAAFLMVQTGPKMIWQFGELGYDISINYNGRVGNKPIPWGDGNLGYYKDQYRQYLYQAYAAINEMRVSYSDVFNYGTATTDMTGVLKSIVIDHADMDVALVGNFDVKSGDISYTFSHTGTWYDYFSGESVDVSSASASATLQPGEFHLYTDKKISEGFPGVVEVFTDPVSITPSPFGLDDEITIVFDASKATTDGTSGLVGASDVYMYSGLIVDDPAGTTLSNVVDDESAKMTKVDGKDNVWSITITPRDYYSVGQDAYVIKIGMYFHDKSGNLGKGFRNQTIFVDVQSGLPIAYFNPSNFYSTDAVSLIFDSRIGDRKLLGADKVYAHSAAVVKDTDSPTFGSYVVGNWGDDDGVGEMTQVGSTSKWELKMSPSIRDFYKLNDTDSIYWVSIVFRNADGSVQASGTPGEFPGGVITDDGNVYVKVNPPAPPVLSVKKQDLSKIRLFPNPTSGQFQLSGADQGPFNIMVFDMTGRVMSSTLIDHVNTPVDLSHLKSGQYFVQVSNRNVSQTVRLLIEH